MVFGVNVFLVLRYIIAGLLVICIFFAPSYLGAANDKKKHELVEIRGLSWLFGYSIVGWLAALFIASRK